MSNKKQACPYDDNADRLREALTGRCETFDGHGHRHDGHRTQVHDSDDKENPHETRTTLNAVKSEAHAVSPRRGSVGRQHTAAAGNLAAAGELARLPPGKL